jgi:membrane-associated protein
MAHEILEVLRHFFHEYGYWTVALALLLENSGLPVPGETTLLLAGFLAYSEGVLRIPYIVLVGIAAATVGDNLGYAIGRYGGRPLLERYRRIFHIRVADLERGESLMQRHGPPVVFFARFIIGMRIITGPLAGALCMEWRRFLIFNFLGAVSWVTVIALVGYFFGRQWDKLIEVSKSVELVILVGIAMVVVFEWRRRMRRS